MDTTFAHFLECRYPITNEMENYSGLSEVSEYFPRDELNSLFRKEINKLLEQPALTLDSRQELLSLREFDWVSYIDRSIRRAGFQDPDLDPLVQDLVVKLLVTGNLFKGWTGGSLKARFLVSLKNAIATLIKKKSKSSKRSHDLPDDVPGRRQTASGLIDDFRDFLRSELGPVAVTVFDHRVAGDDTKELIGKQGIETSYRLKQIVADIKEAARRFAGRDQDFHNMVQKAFDKEAQTMRKRFNRARA